MKVPSKSSNAAESRLQEWIRRDEITEAYEFDASYDGTIGKEALIFREAMFNFFDDARIELNDFNEKKLVRKIHKSLTGDARLKLITNNDIRRSGEFIKFIKWFDKSFQIKSLRQDIYDELIAWQIKSSDPSLKIVDKFENVLDLLDATNDIASPDVVRATLLPVGKQVSIITKAIQKPKPKLFAYTDGFIMRNAQAPRGLSELRYVIERGVAAIASSNIHSNSSNKSDGNMEQQERFVNNISIDQFPQFQNNESRNYNSNNHNNNNNYNNNNNNNYGRSRGHGYNRGYRGNNYRGNYRGNKRGSYRGGYNNNSRGGNRGRYRGGRSRGYRGGYRGGNGRYRSGYRAGYRSGYRGGRGRGGQGGGRYGYADSAPVYSPGYCYNPNCGKWGHRSYECDKIHRPEYHQLLNAYMDLHPKDQTKVYNDNMVNVTQTDNSNSTKTKENANSVTSSLFASAH